MQSKLTGNGRLLNSDGTLTQSGYSTSAVLEYDRKAVKGNKLAIREWDRYIICNENFAVSYAVADNSYYGYISFTLTDFEQKWTHTVHMTNILPLGRTDLPSSPVKGDITHFDKKYFVSFKHDGTARRLVCHFDNFYKGKPLDADIILSQPPEETISVALPFNGAAKSFYYTNKVTGMCAKGAVRFSDNEYIFSPEDSFGALDWSRGVWPRNSNWYWGSAGSFVGEEHLPFSFNIGYGAGDSVSATENTVFFNGKAHKLSKVNFHVPLEGSSFDFLRPWALTSDDKRFEATFVPVMESEELLNLLVYQKDAHQVFGRYYGKVVLDNGTAVEMDGIPGFAEKIKTAW